MTAINSKNTKFEISPTANAAYIKINGLTGFSGLGGGAAAVIDVTDMDSTRKEKLQGIPDEGSMTLNLNYLSTDPGQLALQTARDNQTVPTFRLTSNVAGVSWTYSGFVQSFEPVAGVDKQWTATCGIEITGAVTRGTAS